MLPPAQRAGAVHAYVVALRYAMMTLGISASVLTSVAGLWVRNLDIRTHKPGEKGDGQGSGRDGEGGEGKTPLETEKVASQEV